MIRKLIKKVTVNQSNMLNTGESREIAVYGDVGAEFNINIIKNPIIFFIVFTYSTSKIESSRCF